MRRFTTPDREGQLMSDQQQQQHRFQPENNLFQKHSFIPFNRSEVLSLEQSKRRNVFGERDTSERLRVYNDYSTELNSSRLLENISQNGVKNSEEKEMEGNDMLHLSSRPRTRDEKMRKQRIQADALDQQIEERRILLENRRDSNSGNNSNVHNKYCKVRNSSPVSLAKEHLLDSSYFYSTPKRDTRCINQKIAVQERVYNNRSTSGKRSMADQELSPGVFLTVQERIASQAEIYHSMHNSANGSDDEDNKEKHKNVRLLSLWKNIGVEDRNNANKEMKRLIQDRQSKAIMNNKCLSQERGYQNQNIGEDLDCHFILEEKKQREREVQQAEEGAKRIKVFQRKLEGLREKFHRKDKDTLKQGKYQEKEVGFRDKEPANRRNCQVSHDLQAYQSPQKCIGNEDLNPVQQEQDDILLSDISKRRLHTDDEKLTPMREQKMKKFQQELVLFPIIAKSPKQVQFKSIQKRFSSPVILDLESSAFKKLKEHMPSLISSIPPFTPTKRETEINTNNKNSKHQTIEGISNVEYENNNIEKVIRQDIFKLGMARRQSVREEIGLNVVNSAKKLHEDKQGSEKQNKNGQREIFKK